mgnify:CR=1 FL=1
MRMLFDRSVILEKEYKYPSSIIAKRVIIRKCHMCGELIESPREAVRCPKCNKSFLPLNYSGATQVHSEKDFFKLFSDAGQLEESDTIFGLFVIW